MIPKFGEVRRIEWLDGHAVLLSLGRPAGYWKSDEGTVILPGDETFGTPNRGAVLVLSNTATEHQEFYPVFGTATCDWDEWPGEVLE